MDDFFSKPERKSIRELNLVPVIDMFTTVIFFLILSTSFYGFTKLTVPPSKVSVNTDPLTPPPLGTKLMIGSSRRGESLPEGTYSLLISWVGSSPGQEETSASAADLQIRVAEIAGRFKEKFPVEKTIQLGLQGSVPYQVLIHAMDGVRDKLPDIVLVSPEEASARLTATALSAAGGSR